MATGLDIEFGEATKVGSSIKEKANEFQELLNKVKSANNEIKANWEGADAEKYTGMVEVQAQDMQKLIDTITEVGTFLQKTSKAYEEANMANANQIS